MAVIDTGIDYTHPDLRGSMWVNPHEIPGNGIDDDGNGIVDEALRKENHGWAWDVLGVHSGDIAMENGPFEDVFPIKHGDIPLLC